MKLSQSVTYILNLLALFVSLGTINLSVQVAPSERDRYVRASMSMLVCVSRSMCASM